MVSIHIEYLLLIFISDLRKISFTTTTIIIVCAYVHVYVCLCVCMCTLPTVYIWISGTMCRTSLFHSPMWVSETEAQAVRLAARV